MPGVYGLRRHVDAGSFIAYVTTVAIRSGVGGIFFGGFRDSGAGDDAGLGHGGSVLAARRQAHLLRQLRDCVAMHAEAHADGRERAVREP